MAPRPYWKGHLKLSLVSCPIALYPAIDTSERVAFRQVNRATGNRLRQQLVDSVTGEAVESHEMGRGYEVGENQFVVLEDEELATAREAARTRPYSPPPPAAKREPEQLPAPRAATRQVFEPTARAPLVVTPPAPRIENTRTIEIQRFVPRAQIDPRYHLTPYYIAPRDLVGQEAFAVIRDAMAGKDVVGIAHVVLSNRERPIVIDPLGQGLRGITLRYAHEIRGEDDFFADIPEMVLPDEMLRVAEHIVETKTADFDRAYLEDRYRTELVSMLREKKAQVPARAKPATPSRKNVIDLMDILKRSLVAERPSSRSGAQKLTTRRRAAAAAAKADATKRSKAPATTARRKAVDD
jgi:DNA end-binding protein Ku